MHRHEHDALDHDVAAPRARTEDERPQPLLVQAAVAGRSDVLGASGLLRLQRTVGNAGVRDLAEGTDPVATGTSGGGSPLDAPTRADMEARFGTDFSDVRVHTGEAAHSSAKSVGAHAYTTGSNIVFQRGTYDPESTAGRTMLAHELTHVVQQRSGPVDGTPTGRGVPGERPVRPVRAGGLRECRAHRRPAVADGEYAGGRILGAGWGGRRAASGGRGGGAGAGGLRAGCLGPARGRGSRRRCRVPSSRGHQFSERARRRTSPAEPQQLSSDE